MLPDLLRRILAATATITIAICGCQQASAQITDPPDQHSAPAPAKNLALQIAVNNTAPPGFENVDTAIETDFDIYLFGRMIGTTRARVDKGAIIFLDPDGLLGLLPQEIDRTKVRALIAQPMPDNENLRCPPGQTVNCGTLPSGEAGVIVNPERFTVELVLTPDYISAHSAAPQFLGDPISGPSLIQTAQLSLATGDRFGNNAAIGGTFDTLASIGRTSFVGQTLVRDSGANIQRAYVQHFWNERRASAGLLQQSEAISFTSYRMFGAEYGSFFGSRLDSREGAQTPIQIVLPRAAQVEVYRDGVLIQTTRLGAGVQQINTVNFSAGSYPVRIVARDGGQVLLDEVRVFTRIADLPPTGKWAFTLGAGVRARDFNNFSTNLAFQTQPFFPSLTDQGVVTAHLGRRVGSATGFGATALVVGSKAYGELSATVYRNRLRMTGAVAGGTDGSYSALINSSFRLENVDVSLSARHTRVDGYDPLVPFSADQFRPFFRTEDTVIGGLSIPLLKGAMSLSGSWSRTPGLADRYAYGARYSRSFAVGATGSAQLAGYALKSNGDIQVGVTLTLFRRLNRTTLATFDAGAEYRRRDASVGGGPDGTYPVVGARFSHTTRSGSLDLQTQAGVSTDADRDRVFASADANSNLGHVDAVLDYERVRGGNSGYGLTANMFTGFVVGGGHVKLGVRNQQGDAVAMVSVPVERGGTPVPNGDQGAYRIMIGNQLVGTVAPGETTALTLPSFREYRIGLQPVNSPPYSVDLSPRTVPLYPGNAAPVEFRAAQVITILGRLLDTSGTPIAAARVSAGSDSTVTDEHGYFVITAREDGSVDLYDAAGKTCQTAKVAALVGRDRLARHEEYYRIGDVRCGSGEATGGN